MDFLSGRFNSVIPMALYGAQSSTSGPHLSSESKDITILHWRVFSEAPKQTSSQENHYCVFSTAIWFSMITISRICNRSIGADNARFGRSIFIMVRVPMSIFCQTIPLTVVKWHFLLAFCNFSGCSVLSKITSVLPTTYSLCFICV